MAGVLNEKIQVWGFEGDYIVFADGSLGFGLELTGLDIALWEDGKIGLYASRLTSLVNGLPCGIDVQFSIESSKGKLESVLAQADGNAQDETVSELSRGRRERFSQLAELGLMPQHTFRAFVRQPLDSGARIRPSFLGMTRHYPAVTEESVSRAISKLARIRDEFIRELTALDLNPRLSTQREVMELVFHQWNPTRGVSLSKYDPEDVRDSLLFTDAVLSERGFSLSDTYYRVVSLKILPDQTYSGMARALSSLPFDSTLFLSIHVPDQQKELENLQGQRRVSFSMARGKGVGVSDIESEAKLQDIEDTVSQMISQGEHIFHVSLNVVLRGKDQEELSDRVTQSLTCLRELGGAEGLEETFAAFDIFCNVAFPNARSSERVKRLKTSNLVDFLPLYGPWKGHRRPRILMRSTQGDMLTLDPFAEDLPNFNQMVTGGSGSGKSFLTNLMLLQTLAENPKVFIVDVGGSYKKLCENLGGQYIPLQINSGFQLNPFDLPEGESKPSSHKIKFLLGLVELMTREDGVLRLGKLERAELEDAIQKVYERGEPLGLSKLKEVLSSSGDLAISRLGRILSPWCGDTPFGRVVDRKTTVSLEKGVVCFDLKGLEAYPDLQAVCLFLITDYVWRDVQREPGRIKFLVLDECWKLLESESASTFIAEVFRTFRKYFAGAIAISQSIDDFAKSRVATAILPNTAIKWVLNQGNSDPRHLGEVLQLNEKEIEAIGTLHQERGNYSQVFLMAGNNHITAAIEPTPLEYWIATTDPRDLGKLEELRRAEPGIAGLDLLKTLASRFPGGVAMGER